MGNSHRSPRLWRQARMQQMAWIHHPMCGWDNHSEDKPIFVNRIELGPTQGISLQDGWKLKALYCEIFKSKLCVQIYADNKSAIHILHNNNVLDRSKHIDIKYKFVSEKIEEGEVKVEYLSSVEMSADILTKAVPASHFKKHLPGMGINN